MNSFWKIVNEVIKKSDIILIVLDARYIEATMNKQVEERIKDAGKPVIHVINKCDLVNKNGLDKYKSILHPCVFISSTDYHGLNILKERIFQDGRKTKEGEVIVGVLGYPNTGKSSLINAMTGKSSASTSKMSGWTKSMKKIRASQGMVFLDTPGVIPVSEDDPEKQAIIGSTDFSKVKDPDIVVMKLIDSNPGLIEWYYGVTENEDAEETVEEIAIKNKMLIKGGKPDVKRAYLLILKDWQDGKIR